MGDNATALLRSWLSKNPNGTLNTFFTCNLPDKFESSWRDSLSDEAAKSLRKLCTKPRGGKRQISGKELHEWSHEGSDPTQHNWSTKFSLSKKAQNVYDEWKRYPRSFFEEAGYDVRSFNVPKDLCARLLQDDDDAETQHLHRKGRCYAVYWLAGCGTRTKSSNLCDLAKRFLECGSEGDETTITQALSTKWTAAAQLRNFCIKYLKDEGAVFFLPTSAVEQITKDEIKPGAKARLAKALLEGGIKEEAAAQGGGSALEILRKEVLETFDELNMQESCRIAAKNIDVDNIDVMDFDAMTRTFLEDWDSVDNQIFIQAGIDYYEGVMTPTNEQTIPHPTEQTIPHPTEQTIPHPTEQTIPHPTEQTIPHPTEQTIPHPTEQTVPHHTEQVAGHLGSSAGGMMYDSFGVDPVNQQGTQASSFNRVQAPYWVPTFPTFPGSFISSVIPVGG